MHGMLKSSLEVVFCTPTGITLFRGGCIHLHVTWHSRYHLSKQECRSHQQKCCFMTGTGGSARATGACEHCMGAGAADVAGGGPHL